MKVSEIIYRKLIQHNIKHVFGYSGGACLPLLDQFHKSRHIQFLKNSNENCSGFVAEGYTKSLNHSKPGVIISTSGPGVTNLITPLQNALSDGTPLVAISCQVPTHAINTQAFQECKAIELTKHCTKWNTSIVDPDKVSDIMDKAFLISLQSRKGPVHIDIPKDILLQETKEYNICGNPQYETIETLPEDSKIKHALTNSERPILCVGQGCTHLSEEITEFCETYKIPVTSTIHGMGVVSENNTLSLQMCGMHGNPKANIALQEADLIIGLGIRFDDRITGLLSKYAPNARMNHGIIHVDSCKNQISLVKNNFTKSFTSTDFLHQIHTTTGNFMDTYRRLYTQPYVLYNRESWIQKIRSLGPDYYQSPSSRITTPCVIKKINKVIENNNINRDKLFISTGVGNHQMWTAQHITWTKPQRMITSGSLGTMGVGVPFAIGSKLANPHSTVLCIDGDSSFNMTSNELQTILENNINVKIAIMNDKRQQMVYTWQKLFHDSRIIATENINPDYNKLSEAYEIHNIYCNSYESLEKDITDFMLYDKGPVIAVFDVEPSMCFPLVSPGKALHKMILSDLDIHSINKKQVAPN